MLCDIIFQTEDCMWYETDSKIKSEIFRIMLLTAGAALMAFNINAFINNGGLVPGGFSGVTVLLQRIFRTYAGIEIPFSAINIPLNCIGFYIGFKFIGKKFTLCALYVIVLSSILTDAMPNIPITYDVLLVALFGAVVNGLAITLCLHAGACSGGTDFISIYMSEKRGVDAWNYIFAGNVVVLVISGLLFGFDKALYSIIYQFAQTQILGALNKTYQKHTIWVFTDKPDEVYTCIRELSNHGSTLFKGVGCYRQEEQPVICSVVGSEEVPKLIKAIKEIDDKAFINVQKSDLVTGNFYKRPTE